MCEPGRVSVLIVNYNGGRLLEHCLSSVGKQTRQPDEVIVVDNGSADCSWDLPQFSGDPVYTLIRLNRNAGFSEANNLAYERSCGEWIVLLNNDVELAHDWLEEMVKSAADEKVGSVACQLRQKNHPDRMDCAGFEICFNGSTTAAYGQPVDTFSHEEHHPFGAVASAALYRRSAIEQLGTLFHPEYFAYYEDTDLAIRLRLFGYDTVYAPRAVAWHVGSATGVSQSAFQRYHLRRNIEYIFWVNFPLRHIIKYAVPHAMFECTAALVMIRNGMGKEFFKAKRDALVNIKWIFSERNALHRKLDKKNYKLIETKCAGIVEYMKNKRKMNAYLKISH